ncbi:MAG: exosortase/archaeosortase family protein [Anaerolineae bacterium]|jgi:exosortase
MAKDKSALVSYLVIAGLLLLLAYPALLWLVRSWISNPYYSHGFLVLPIAALLAWRKWHPLKTEHRDSLRWPGLVLILTSLAAIVWAMRWQSYFVSALALVVLLTGILFYLEGWARVRHWLFPLLFLAFMVPLPFIDLASPWLEAFTANSATSLAHLVGIEAVQQGGEITLPGTTFVVGAPCSGLRSLVAMVTVAVGWIYVVEGRLWAKSLMVAAVLPLVALSNVLRIAILLAVAQLFGQEAALTYYHDWSSPILFLMALALLLVLGKVLGCSRVREDIF